jgi:TMEM175 potassium channel family protein
LEDHAVADQGFISKSRLDALTDGVFAFAMTLLVINIELGDDFDPKTNAELIRGLLGLADTIVAYVVTFAVLALFWLGRATRDDEPEAASNAYAWAVLLHLFFVTLLPFSMVVVGRFDLAPAIWIYGGNMILLALTGAGISYAVQLDVGHRLVATGRKEFALLIASALLSMIIAVFSPDHAMIAYLLNLASPLIPRRR